MKKTLTVVLLIGATLLVQVVFGAVSYAANPADFNPGRIIDDEVFYNKDSMSVSDIQAFLNAHTPPCDTWGTGPSGYGGLTNAQYAQQIMGWPGPPYVCLNNYYENPSTGQTSFEMGGGAFSGGQSAAQMIYNAAQQYSINPQVLLVTLRKESLNLYSDSWPMKSQYKYAMGYACPDSGPNNSANCDSQYAGFYNQVNKSAWQFRYYYDHMGSYNYAPGRWNTIQYSPDASCGSTNVFIDNYATASLYIYTPYTPNQASLNAYPGTVSCGSYGNRNFWFFWQEWFGSTYAGVHITSPLRITSQFGSTLFSDVPTTVSFDMRNDSSSPINVGGMSIAVRDSAGGNHDYPLVNLTIPAHSTLTYSQTQTLNREDVYTFSIANFSNGTWSADYPSMMNVVEPRSKTVNLWSAPTLTQGITVQNGPFHMGKTSTVTYTVKNNSAFAQTIGSLGLAVRGPSGQSLDPSPAASVTIAAGQSQTLSYQFKPLIEGRYTISVAALLSDWTSGYPIPVDQSVNASSSLTALPQVTLDSSLSAAGDDIRTDQSIQLQFTVKNYGDDPADLGKLGLWGRDPQGRNIDPGVVSTVLSPGETRVMSFSFKTNEVGNYKFGVLGQRNGSWNSGPVSIDGYSNSIVIGVKNSIVTTGTPSLVSGAMGYVGQSNSVQFTVKNYGNDPADLGKLGLWGRDPQGRNIDPGVVSTVLSPGETRVMSFPVKFMTLGSYKFGILQTVNNGQTWLSGPALEGSAQNTASIDVTSGAYTGVGLQSSIDINHVHATQMPSLTFSITNQTTGNLNLGKLGLWGRDPQGRNIDPGVVSTVLSPGETRVMSFNVPLNGGPGIYQFGILGTMDNGASWNSGPDMLTGQLGTMQMIVKPSVTVISSLTTQNSSISAGQCTDLSFTVRNYDSANPADLGKLGLWGRDPQGRNIDPGVVSTVLSPGETRVITMNVCTAGSGIYTYGILGTKDNGISWTDGPIRESGTIVNQVQVKAS